MRGACVGLGQRRDVYLTYTSLSERIPPNESGVAATLAEYAHAPVNRERAADRRAGSLAGQYAVRGACRTTGSWSRERALAWGARTHATAAACPPASPASRQLRSKGPTQASAILRLAMGRPRRGVPLVSTIARGVDRAFLSPHCRSADPSTPAGRLAVSPRLEDLPDRPQGRTVTEGAQAEALGTRYATAKIVELDLFTSSQAMFRRVPCLG